MDFSHKISNISTSPVKIIDAKVNKEMFEGRMQQILTAQVKNCPFGEGEEIEIDTDKMKLIGTIVWKMDELIKVKMTKLITIN